MHNRLFVLLLICSFSILWTACEDPPIEEDAKESLLTSIQGSWVATDSDVGGIYVDIVDSFQYEILDTLYVLAQTDQSGASITYAGLFSIDENLDSTQQIHSIRFYQYEPDTIISEGIMEWVENIEPQELMIDVVPVDSNNYVLPSIEEGFGSGEFGIGNIQRFRR